MIIPSKHSGYQAGIRLYPGGGGGGGSSAPTTVAPPPPPPDRMASAAPPPTFQTYGSGDRTGSLVQSGSSWRPSTLDYSKPIYDPNYADNITGYQQSSQFYQPIYQQEYQNYANPLTAFNVSSYGTNPARSNASQWWQNQGATDQQYMQRLRDQAPSYQNMNIGQLAQNMQQFGISPSDMQAAGSYGGSTFGGFNPGNYMPQMQTPFNPYTNTSMGGYGGGYGGYSGYGMQSPFSYQQQAQPNYGPSQAIVGRSSQMRGTPNVMRRAEGGITSLLGKDE